LLPKFRFAADRHQNHRKGQTGVSDCDGAASRGATLVVKRLAKAVEHSQNGESMEALVPQFQEELAFGQKKASELLRIAQLISAKLRLDDILQWINHELNGYPNGTAVPEYRHFEGGSLQILNPLKGWNHVAGHRTFSEDVRQPVTELEVLAKEDFIVMEPPTPYPLVALTGNPREFPVFKQRITFSGSNVVGLLEGVKNRLLNWSIELEQRGIVGANMSFNEKEQSIAKSQTFNIQTMHGVIGDPQNSQINIYDYSSIHQTLKDHGIPQQERNEIETILDELKSAKPEEKHTWFTKAKQWVSKNTSLLGDLGSVLIQAIQKAAGP
jgi:hypothetical protein